MNDREEKMGRAMSAMRDTLEAIANGGDCHYIDDRDRGLVCPCPVCRARRVLDLETNDLDWRVMGARYERCATMHREAAIVAAWKRYAIGDRGRTDTPEMRLAMILGETSGEGIAGQRRILNDPTPRDWFVASSVIQWLATNVGSALLHEAGYVYRPTTREE